MAVLNALVQHGGSGGGARPKVTVARNRKTGMCQSGFMPLQPGFEHWMVKFRHAVEPVDTGRAEKAYADFGRAAGLVVPETDLMEVKVNGVSEAYFASKRFDRQGDNKIHMLSLAGFLHASHRTPSVDYGGVLGATRYLTGSVAETSKASRQMVFNVIAYNRDDHTKNFAFLFQNGQWTTSPSYDLAMSPNVGMGGQHMAAINGQGDPARKDVLAVANDFDISGAKDIIAQVIDAAADWEKYASVYDVGFSLTSEIGDRIKRMVKRVGTPT